VPVPTLLLGVGLIGGPLLALGLRPVVGVAARRKARRAARRMREAVAAVARDLVLDPVREVLRAYAEARAAVRRIRVRAR
jgi:hypothetical protein